MSPQAPNPSVKGTSCGKPQAALTSNVRAHRSGDRFDLPQADCMSESGETIALTGTIMPISTLHTLAHAILPTCRNFSW